MRFSDTEQPEAGRDIRLSGVGAGGDLIDRHSLEQLAEMAGLRNPAPLERLLGSPRYRTRLNRFFAFQAERRSPADPQVKQSFLNQSTAELAAFMQGLGLCWSLSQLCGMLTPQDMQGLRATFQARVIELANSGMALITATPDASPVNKGDWLRPEVCSAIGQSALFGWLEAKHREAVRPIALYLGIDPGQLRAQRLSALDGVIENYLSSLRTIQ